MNEKEIFRIFKDFLLEKSFDDYVITSYDLEDMGFEEETGISIDKIYDILYDYVYNDFDVYVYDWIDDSEDNVDFSVGSWNNLSSYERRIIIGAADEGYHLYKMDMYRYIGGIENIRDFKEFVACVDCLNFLDNRDIEDIVKTHYNRIAEFFDDEDEGH